MGYCAGGDTTATALAGCFFYLSRNPESYKRLTTEIRSAFASAAEIRGGPKLAGCAYLRACIDEALRMASPVPTTLWREQDPADDGSRPLVVDGHVIPRGTLVGVNIYSLHHNDEYFPDPFTFRPERWLEDDHSQARAAFTPYQEITLALAKTLWYFDFEPAAGDLGKIGGGGPDQIEGRQRGDEFQIQEIFGAYNDGPYLTFHPRGHYHEELAE
jgi:cytochrome P450